MIIPTLYWNEGHKKKLQIPTLLIIFNLKTLGDRRRMLADAFASRLCNIQGGDTAIGRQKLQARNTQKALEICISFRRIVETVRIPHGKGQLLRMQDRKRERIRGIMHRPLPGMKGLPPCVTTEVSNRWSSRMLLAFKNIPDRLLCSVRLQNYIALSTQNCRFYKINY